MLDFTELTRHILQHVDECRCGNSYGRHGKVDETECDTTCNGNGFQICGGGHRNSVYKVPSGIKI